MQTSALSSSSSRPTASLIWSRWFQATTLGAVLGLTLAIYALFLLGSFGLENLIPIPEVQAVVIGTFLGLGIGGVQGILLQRILLKRVWWQWLFVTWLGTIAALVAARLIWVLMERSGYSFVDGITGLIFSQSLSEVLPLPAASSIAAGLVFGTTQALLLRHYLRPASWWILGTTVGISFSVLFTLILLYMWPRDTDDHLGAEALTYIVIGACLPWVVFGALSGFLLRWMVGKTTEAEAK